MAAAGGLGLLRGLGGALVRRGGRRWERGAATTAAGGQGARASAPEVNGRGCTFPRDLRATSGVGAGDGLAAHTAKWLDGPAGMKGPMELVADEPPQMVEGAVVACYGHDTPGLGHPVEYVKVLEPHKKIYMENEALDMTTHAEASLEEWRALMDEFIAQSKLFEAIPLAEVSTLYSDEAAVLQR